MPRRPKIAPSPAARRRKLAPRRGRARLLVPGAAILAAIAVAVTLVTRREPPSSPPAVEAELPPLRMSYPALVALANQVKSLQIEKRYAESLPGTRALLRHELGRRLTPAMLVDYARILNNVAFEPGIHAPRSSFERVSFEREALQSCLRALATASTAPESSEAMTLVGLIHEAWGFPDDAYLTYVAATETDPQDPEARRRLDAFVRRMNPTGPAGSR